MATRRVKCPHCGFEFDYPVQELAEASTTDVARMWTGTARQPDAPRTPDVVELVCPNPDCRQWFRWSISGGCAITEESRPDA